MHWGTDFRKFAPGTRLLPLCSWLCTFSHFHHFFSAASRGRGGGRGGGGQGGRGGGGWGSKGRERAL